MEELPPHVVINRAVWTAANAAHTDRTARSSWQQDSIDWGVWHSPEAELRVLPEVQDRDVIELGCGTAYFGAWLKKRGARRVVGIDITPAQLETARRMNEEFGLGLELIEANAEQVPLDGNQFDLAISEYGASIWADPNLWIPEAARLLRPGGELVFLRNSTLSMLCAPDTGSVTTTLQRPLRALRRIEWADDDPGVEFHPGTGEMFRILRQAGFEVLDLIELFAPEDATQHPYYDYVPVEWARQWPPEEIWKARKLRATTDH
ncbi:MAG TPA: class I SAM-dependent methyltransferase [Chloroflexota bacterium]|nr:class I SAM-dependent methyltransferase [Chloroflexota bacterium]